MEPTIRPGDFILINQHTYGLRAPFIRSLLPEMPIKRGDIVTFREPSGGPLLVKRVVGLPNETIEMKNNRLTIDGVAISYNNNEEKLFGKPHDITAKYDGKHPLSNGGIKVPMNCYYLLGDNRDNSKDSRVFGPISRLDILGKGVKILGSLKDKTRTEHTL